jgi:hypothetical protein
MSVVHDYGGGSHLMHPEDVDRLLDSIPVRFRDRRGAHLQILPPSNLKPFSPEDEATIALACYREGLGVTRELVSYKGRYFYPYIVRPGHGFRLYPDPSLRRWWYQGTIYAQECSEQA